MNIYLSKPHLSGSEQKMVEEALRSNFVAPIGPQLDAFEESVNKYLGGGFYCVALSSGSAALHIALRLAGVGVNDEVWVSSMTFAGGVFPINYLGALPRFFDLSLDTWTIDLERLETELHDADLQGRLPKVIVPTDLYGQSVDLNQLELIAEKYGIGLVVDSAESLGAECKGNRKAGTGGDASIISFNGNKIITTSGGGMLVTRHKDWAEKARFLATQARDPAPHYQHSTYGYNYRLSNICAAIGLAQMDVLEERVVRRREIFNFYKDELSGYGLVFMPEVEGFKSSRWLTTVNIDPKKVGVNREQIRLELLANKIQARPLWKPMHLQPLYSGCQYHGSGVDEYLFDTGLCLPSGSCMTINQQTEVIDVIKSFIEKSA